MAKPKLKLVTEADVDAAAINELFHKAEEEDAQSLQYYWDCGDRLLVKRADPEMGGKWMAWVGVNLEFDVKTAELLIKFRVANSKPASNIPAAEADRLRCNLWGREAGRHGNLKGQYEWYTPLEIIEAAREVMGGIDLDPASCEHANKIVKAAKYYTEEDDGLKKEWEGRIFINPPFAHPAVKYFAHKLMESLGGGVDQAVWLSNACVDVVWWHQLAEIGIVCFHKGRIKFYGEDGDLQPPTLGQSIFYFGDNRDKFREVFSKFGVVLS